MKFQNLPMMFCAHAQMVVFSEHAQDVLLFYVHDYLVGGLSMPTYGCSVHMPIMLNLSSGVLNRPLSHIWV